MAKNRASEKQPACPSPLAGRPRADLVSEILALNRDMTADGWVHLVPVGEYPGMHVDGVNKRHSVMQVIDDESLNSIMAEFRAQSALPNWRGLLVDADHFSHDLNHSSEAFGWIKQLERRADGIWGLVEWTDLGREAINSKRYKTLSPALALEQMTGDRYRAVALLDAGLTNKPRLKTLVPVTNRDLNNTEGTQMREQLLQLLSLPADATDDQIVEAITALRDKAAQQQTAATEATNRATAAEKERDALKTESLNRDADEFVAKHVALIQDPAKMKTLFVSNRKAAEDMIALIKPAAAPAQTLNRADGNPPADIADADKKPAGPGHPQWDAVMVVKNREGCSFSRAWDLTVMEKPELFRNAAQK